MLYSEHGHSDMIILISEYLYSGTSIYSDTICCAAEYGKLNILQWAFNKQFDRCEDVRQEVIYLAAREGHMHILEWSHNNWIDFEFHHYLFQSASGIAKAWARDNNLIN